jgi:hypothetical protein
MFCPLLISQLFYLRNSHLFLSALTIAPLMRKCACQTSAFGFSLNTEKRNGRSVNFTEPLRLSGRLSRVTNFGIAAKNLHFVLCQHYTIADISKVIITTQTLHLNTTASSNSTKQGPAFTELPLLFLLGLICEV